MIAHNPLHGSGRAAFPHPALALGNNAHAAQGIGITDDRYRQPAGDQAPHAVPKDATVLTAPRQRAMPEPPHLEPKDMQRSLVKGHTVIPDVYPLQRTGRIFPARCPGRVLLWQVPFGQTLSLCPLRHRLSGIVRRLPRSVRHRRTSLDFPMRPEATAALGELGISRCPREVFAYVHGVSDRAGLWHTSRYRCSRWRLPLLLTASASRSNSLTRLNTRPARSPVNASMLPLRAAPHDSGPMWVASSHSYDFCIHYTSPV
jgi:hypothetical protein